MNYTLGYGLMALVFGTYLIVDRDSWARSCASGQRRWKRWFGIDLPGQREEEQKPYVVMLGVVCMVLGMGMIAIGGYWWVTS